MLKDLSLVALVAGISKTSETTVQTCDISSRWACERSLKNCTIDLKVWRFPDSDEGILFVNTSKCNFSWSLHTSPR